MVGVIVNQRMVTTVVISTTHSISAGPVRPLSQQQTPILSYQRQTHDVSLLKKSGSTVVEYFEWDLPKVLSQEGAELVKYADNRRFYSEPDEVESNRDTDSKTSNGISQRC